MQVEHAWAASDHLAFAKAKESTSGNADNSVLLDNGGSDAGGLLPRSQRDWKRNAFRAALTLLTSTFENALMLVAMTFNVGIFFCLILGYALGALLFGHATAPSTTVAMVTERRGEASSAPTNGTIHLAVSSLSASEGCCG